MSMMLLFLTLLLPAGDELSPKEMAEQILTSAAVAQRGETPVPRPASLHGIFSVTAVKQDGSGTFSVEVERFYERSPERMLTRRTENLAKSDSSVGFDGDVFWMQDNRTDEVIIYSADPETFHTDLALEEEQLELTRLILDMISIDGLTEQLIEPTYLGQETLNVPSRRRKGDDRLVNVLTAQIPDIVFAPDANQPPPLPGEPAADDDLLAIKLFIDTESHYVHRVELFTIDRAEPQMWQMVLSRHSANAQNLVVPGTILILDGRGETVATLGLIPDELGLPIFELGQPIDPQIFTVPE
ncbi:MAG: hypothetical protein ACI9EF_000580 [Pseudohongiellaceae bacterium]|jgi:hypothetical protein